MGNKSAMDVKDVIGFWDFVALYYLNITFLLKKTCPVYLESFPAEY
jgi:hypothetical protein